MQDKKIKLKTTFFVVFVNALIMTHQKTLVNTRKTKILTKTLIKYIMFTIYVIKTTKKSAVLTADFFI